MLPDKEVLIPMCTSIKTSRRFGIGNVRVSYSRDPQTGIARIVEENNYYPYGLQHSGYNNDVWLNQANTEGQKITFNSRELQNEFDLFVVAMDFRQYDPALGRFTAMDLLAEKYLSFTPYQFGNNNPVYWADPSGLEGMPGWLQDIWDASPSNAATTWTNNNNGGFTITNIVYYPLSLDAGGSGGGGGFGFDGSSLGVGVGTTYSFMTGVLTTPQGNFINFGANSWHSAEGIMLEGITVTGRIGNLNVPYGQLIGSILANMPNSGGGNEKSNNSIWSNLVTTTGFASTMVGGLGLSYLIESNQVHTYGKRINGKVRSAETLTRYYKISNSKVAKTLGYAGRVLGVVGFIDSTAKLLSDPKNPANWVKFGSNALLLVAKANPYTFVAGLAYNVLDSGGYIDKWFGN